MLKRLRADLFTLLHRIKKENQLQNWQFWGKWGVHFIF